MVANLPYGVAATVLLQAIASCPRRDRWVAMVQREVAERLAAAPGAKGYGATSVLAQLACEVRVLRKVPRTVFHPEPNVDSALVVLRRRGAVAARGGGGARARRLRAPAQGAGRIACAHARRARRHPRRHARRPEQLGHPADARAERLPPADWPRLAERSAASGSRSCDPARSLPRVSRGAPRQGQPGPARGRPREDGMHPICSLMASIELADELTAKPRDSGADSVNCPGVPGDNLAARALADFRSRAG